jgi:hypothetical protein
MGLMMVCALSFYRSMISFFISSLFSEKLRQYFQQFGSVHDAVVMKDPVSRRSRGFGFITYEHASEVDKALAQEIHTIDARQVSGAAPLLP